jgi:uncharacterized protein YukE
MSIMSIILRFARKVVGNVLSQLTQQLNVVQEQAYQPMQQMVQQVMGGVWVGKGADAFVEEVSSIMMPGVGKIGDGISGYQKNIQHAIDTIDQADQVVNNLVNGIADIFGGIF